MFACLGPIRLKLEWEAFSRHIRVCSLIGNQQSVMSSCKRMMQSHRHYVEVFCTLCWASLSGGGTLVGLRAGEGAAAGLRLLLSLPDSKPACEVQGWLLRRPRGSASRAESPRPLAGEPACTGL